MMKDSDYIAAAEKIRTDAQRLTDKLRTEYMKANARFNVGKLIEDEFGQIIIIDNILYHSPNTISNRTKLPQIVYRGRMFTQKGRLRKDEQCACFRDSERFTLKAVVK